jgi:hypothetical protein
MNIYNDQKTAQDRLPWKYSPENRDKLFGLPISFPEQELPEVVDEHTRVYTQESINEIYALEANRSQEYGD